MAKRGLVGSDAVRRKLRALGPAASEELRRMVETGAEDLQTAMLASVPVRSGKLRQGILKKVSRDGLNATVGFAPDKPGFKRLWRKVGWRAGFIERGTKRSRAQPFIKPARDQVIPRLVPRLQREVRRIFANIGKS